MSEQKQQFRTHLSAFSLVLCAAGLATLWAGVTHPNSEPQFQDFVAGAVAIGAGVALLAVAQGWMKILQNQIQNPIFHSVWILLVLGAWMFVKRFGMYQVDGTSYGFMIDLGWRAHLGQIPYMDFPCSFPVFFVLASKLAFKWFGPYWSSIIAVQALFTAVTFAWMVFLLSKLMGRTWFSLLLAAALQITANLSYSVLWYNIMTTIAGSLYTLSALLWLRQPASAATWLSYGLSMVLLAGLKPNTAAPLILSFSVILFIKSIKRFLLVCVSFAALWLFWIILWLNQINLPVVLGSYLGVSSRGYIPRNFLTYLGWAERDCFIVALASVTIPAIWLLYHNRRSWRHYLIPGIGFLAGLYAHITNCDWWADLTLILCGLALIVDLDRSDLWQQYVTGLCMVLAAAGIAQGICRERVKTAGVNLFFQYDGNKYILKDGLFAGTHCGDLFTEILREESLLLKTNTGSIWFGPVLKWGYAAFNMEPPKSQPIAWNPDVFGGEGKRSLYFEQFMDSRFETLIFFKDMPEGYTQEELRRIGEAYVVDESFHTLTVAHLRTNR
jgi:hypothetical protein